MITKYDLLKIIEKETLRRMERNLQFAYQDIREILMVLHRQLNASMGYFETDQEIYERYIKKNHEIQKINTYSKGEGNVYWDAVTYNAICKKRIGINDPSSLQEREWFRSSFRTDSNNILREFDLKCGDISREEFSITHNKLVAGLNDFTEF